MADARRNRVLNPISAPTALALAVQLACAASFATLVACGDGAPIPEPPPPVGENPEFVDQSDLIPPEFTGVSGVLTVGFQMFELQWTAATDERSERTAIRYEVMHVPQPFGALTDAEPIAMSEPGVVRTTVQVDGPVGRFWIRAVDEAGNRSGTGLPARPRASREWVTIEDGAPASALTSCAVIEPGRTLCVGDGGVVARWDRDTWTSLPQPTNADLSVVSGDGFAIAYGMRGEMFRFTGAEEGVAVDVLFRGREPELPFRSLSMDRFGLLYWIDASGHVFIGADARFEYLDRPLALPEADACPTLRGIAFNDEIGFAVCGDGTVFSYEAREPGVRWMQVTSSTPFDLDNGLSGLVGSRASRGTLITPNGIYVAEVGGWRTLEEADGDPFTHFGRPIIVGEDTYIATDAGIAERSGDDWSVLSGASGSVAGIVESSALDRDTRFSIVYDDGAIRGVGGGSEWAVPRRIANLTATTCTSDGFIVASLGDSRADPSLQRYDDGRWRTVTDLPATPSSVSVLAVDSQTWLGGEDSDGGWLRSSNGRTWSTPALLQAAPVVPAEPGAPALNPPTEPALQAIGIGAVSADASVTLGPVRSIDTRGSRTVIADDSGIWWGVSGGVFALSERANVDYVWLDAGDRYVTVESGSVFSCWRDVCSPFVGAPASVRGVSRQADGWHILADDGSVSRFVAASVAAGQPLDAESTPQGTFETVSAATSIPAGATMRLSIGDAELALGSAGEVFERHDGDWVVQGTTPTAMVLAAFDEQWAVLSERGWLTLGTVPTLQIEQGE